MTVQKDIPGMYYTSSVILSITVFLVAINSTSVNRVDWSIFSDDLAIYITRNQRVATRTMPVESLHIEAYDSHL